MVFLDLLANRHAVRTARLPLLWMMMILRFLLLCMKLRESGKRGGLEGRRRERQREGPGGTVSSEATRDLNVVHGKAYYLKPFVKLIIFLYA